MTLAAPTYKKVSAQLAHTAGCCCSCCAADGSQLSRRCCCWCCCSYLQQADHDCELPVALDELLCAVNGVHNPAVLVVLQPPMQPTQHHSRQRRATRPGPGCQRRLLLLLANCPSNPHVVSPCSAGVGFHRDKGTDQEGQRAAPHTRPSCCGGCCAPTPPGVCCRAWSWSPRR